MPLNEKYSFRDFTGRSFTDRPASEFNDTTIKGSCFYQECGIAETRRAQVERHIFPAGMTGVTFERCNLDNVYVPPGNTVTGDCSHLLLAPQNDLEDWVLDDALRPVEPVNKRDFQELGLSIDPVDIPDDAGRLSRPRTHIARDARVEGVIR